MNHMKEQHRATILGAHLSTLTDEEFETHYGVTRAEVSQRATRLEGLILECEHSPTPSVFEKLTMEYRWMQRLSEKVVIAKG